MENASHRVWTFEEFLRKGGGRKAAGGKFALWQPNQIVVTTGAAQQTDKSLKSAAFVFGTNDGTNGHILLEQPLSRQDYDEYNAPAFDEDIVPIRPREDYEVEVGSAALLPRSVPVSQRATTVFDDRRWKHVAPVYGSYVRFTNKVLPYYPLPAKLDEVRLQIFDVTEPLLLHSQQIADFWLHMSNVWKRSSLERPKLNANGTMTESWICSAKVLNAKRVRKTQRRLKRTDDMTDCPAAIKIVSFTNHACGSRAPVWFTEACHCVPEWIHLWRPWNTQHNHDLEASDVFRRSDGIQLFTRQKVEDEHWTPLTVYDWIQRDLSGATSQLQHLTRGDISSATKHWRLANKHIEIRNEESAGIGVPLAELKRRQQAQDAVVFASREQLQILLTEIFVQTPEACDVALRVLPKPAVSEKPCSEFSRSSNESREVETNGVSASVAQGFHLNIPPPGVAHEEMQQPAQPSLPPEYIPPPGPVSYWLQGASQVVQQPLEVPPLHAHSPPQSGPPSQRAPWPVPASHFKQPLQQGPATYVPVPPQRYQAQAHAGSNAPYVVMQSQVGSFAPSTCGIWPPTAPGPVPIAP